MNPTDEELTVINKMIVRPYLLGQTIQGLLAGRLAAITATQTAEKAIQIVDKVMELEAKRV